MERHERGLGRFHAALARPSDPARWPRRCNLFVGRRLGRLAGCSPRRRSRCRSSFSLVAGRGAARRCRAEERVGSPAPLRLDLGRARSRSAPTSGSTSLSATMILVVTGVGSLIHVYAIGYMEGDPRYGRFFAYMNLFVFFMLMLVLADNYLVLYLGWEGVGLCSYLLIGFWFEKTENANAAKKAFVTTRIGDTAMLIGLALIVCEVRDARLRGRVRRARGDDREGHGDRDRAAAVRRRGRQVRAGAAPRLAARRDGRPDPGLRPDPRRDDGDGRRVPRRAEHAALRALRRGAHRRADRRARDAAVRGDVRARRRTTSSACSRTPRSASSGSCSWPRAMRFYTGAMFMLVAHAFYKALMFLGAGSVMHGMHEETDMQRMGGLIRRMPVTGWTFVVGALRVGRRPPLAGLLREGPDPRDREPHRPDVDLRPRRARRPAVRALHRSAGVPHVLRSPRSEEAEHAHESPSVMTIPLVVLAAGAASPGWSCRPPPRGRLARFLEPVVGPVPDGRRTVDVVLSVIATAIALRRARGRLVGLRVRPGRVARAPRAAPAAPARRAERLVRRRCYSTLFVNPGTAAARFTAYVFDTKVVDGLVNGVGAGDAAARRAARRVQTGFVRTYALAFFLGAVGVLVWLGSRL